MSDEAATAESPGIDASAVPPESGADAPASAADAVTPRVYRHGPSRRLTAAQSIDENVQRLARGLDLDPGQQVRLRTILVDQRRQLTQLRSGGSGASGNVTAMMWAIYDQTRTRIRAMLTEEQKKKYPAATPRDQTAPAQADLKHWMSLQESRRTQDSGAPQ